MAFVCHHLAFEWPNRCELARNKRIAPLGRPIHLDGVLWHAPPFGAFELDAFWHINPKLCSPLAQCHSARCLQRFTNLSAPNDVEATKPLVELKRLRAPFIWAIKERAARRSDIETLRKRVNAISAH